MAYLLTLSSSALYLRGDPYETSDAVFGVKESLVVDLKPIAGVEGLAEKYSVPESALLLSYDFVLVTHQETAELRDQNARDEIGKQSRKLKIVDGMIIPDI